MPHLHQTIASKVAEWQRNGFAVDDFDAIAEILDFQVIEPESGVHENRFLRTPQIEALRTYWWLRLVAETPHVLDLYRQCFSQNTALLEGLGLQWPAISSFVVDNGINALFDKVRNDADFVAEHKLQALRETLTLGYLGRSYTMKVVRRDVSAGYLVGEIVYKTPSAAARSITKQESNAGNSGELTHHRRQHVKHGQGQRRS